MYRLKRYNVIKETDSKHKADRLVHDGFTIVSHPSFKNAVTSTPKPSIGVEDEQTEEETEENFDCPHCDKSYKSEKTLNNHIDKEHSEE